MPRGQRIDIGAPADSPAVMQAAGLVNPTQRVAQSYMDLLGQQGVFFDSEWGVLAHWAPDGPRREGKFPVAVSAEEARENTRAGKLRRRWDYYVAGLKCRECANPLTGWALGGRKLQAEHDHVTEATPELYRVVALDDDADEAAVDDPVAVGA